MTERPILFSGPMVRAILAGTKTQTRRVVTPKRLKTRMCPYGVPGDRLWVRETWSTYNFGIAVCSGQPSIRGTMRGVRGEVNLAAVHRAGKENYAWGMYGEPRWRPSIHMPRTACRLVLEVTGVRVERLQDISSDDAIAEGIEPSDVGDAREEAAFNVADYAELWNTLNAKRGFGWSTNPWVWVVEFTRLPEKAAALEAT